MRMSSRLVDSRRQASVACITWDAAGSGYSVRDVIDTARQITGREIPNPAGAAPSGDPARLVASFERIRRELGWTPRYPELARSSRPRGAGCDAATS